MTSTTVQCPTCSVFPLIDDKQECACCAFWRGNDVKRSDIPEASRLFRDYYDIVLADNDRHEDPIRQLGTCIRTVRQTPLTVVGWLTEQVGDCPKCLYCDRHVSKKYKLVVCRHHRAWIHEFRERYGSQFVDGTAINALLATAIPLWESVVSLFPNATAEELWSLFEVELGDRLPPAPIIEAPVSPPTPPIEPVAEAPVQPSADLPLGNSDAPAALAVEAAPASVPSPSAGVVTEAPFPALAEAPPSVPPESDAEPATSAEPAPAPPTPSPATPPIHKEKVVRAPAKPRAKPKQLRLPCLHREWTQTDRNWFKRARIFEWWPWLDDYDRGVEALAVIKDRWCARSGLPKYGSTSATTIFTRDHLEDAIARIFKVYKSRTKRRRKR